MVEVRKGVDGGFKRVTKSKQCLEASTTTPPRTADGLTAVSQRPNVDPSSENSLLSSPKFSRSHKPCQFCLLARQGLEISGRPTQHNAHRFHSVCRTGFVSCRATARVHREQLVGWSQLMRRGNLKPPTSIPGYVQDTELHPKRQWLETNVLQQV